MQINNAKQDPLRDSQGSGTEILCGLIHLREQYTYTYEERSKQIEKVPA